MKGTFVLVPAAESGHGRDIVMTRKDVNEIQLAKAAIRGGIETLLASAGMTAGELGMRGGGRRLWHAPGPAECHPGWHVPGPAAGALPPGGECRRGGGPADAALTTRRREAEAILGRVEYLELTVVPNFTRLYTNSMYFSEPA